MDKILTWLVSPFGIFVCGLTLGGTVASLSSRRQGRARRTGLALCAIAVVQLIAFSWYPIADLMVRPLEEGARRMALADSTETYSAILLLGGVGRPPTPGANQYLVLTDAASRVWHAARLYHAGVAPRIIVSGGSLPTANGATVVPEAEALRPLLHDLGVPNAAIVIEPRSHNTRENAQESRRLVGDQDRIALVTSAFHMPRAMGEMQFVGIRANAFPTDFRVSETRPLFQEWLPNAEAQQLSTIAIKEWLGLLVQSIRRIIEVRR